MNWLLLLERVGANILADDMGLGKTIQTIAYLAASRAQKLAQDLVIKAGTSSSCRRRHWANWQREFSRWAPYEKSVVVYRLAAGALASAGRPRRAKRARHSHDLHVVGARGLRGGPSLF